jgi:parvulin-like peptidyl-prolyl isomerase
VATLALAGASAPDPQAARSGVVAATVGEEPIDASEVARLLKAATRERKVSPAALPVLQAQALAEIVDRRLVLAYARRTREYPKAEEIGAAAAALKSRLATEGRTLDDYLHERSLDETDLRRELAWGLVWDKYLAKYVTEARVAAHFEAHRRQFDGTELAVSHILLRPPSVGRIANPSYDQKRDADRTGWDALLQQAAAIRRSILAGEITFADAAKKHSAGPSGKEGGQLGFIPRRGVMDEAFSRAAFTLDVGEISDPVVTPFGVHLIRCDAIRPGTKQLADVRKELEDALARELLDRIARLEDRHTPVRFTGKSPHFKPGTRELIVP